MAGVLIVKPRAYFVPVRVHSACVCAAQSTVLRSLADPAGRGLLSIGVRIKFFLNLSAAPIGDLFPGLVDLVKGLFWLFCAREDGGDAYIEFVPIIRGSGNS
jgi:hypothetical protein